MEKRVLIAVFLSFLVIYVYQALMPAPPKPLRVKPATQAATAPANAQPATQAPPAALPAGDEPVIADANAREIIIETDAVRAVFSTRGAVLKQWTLKRYLEGGQSLQLMPTGLGEDAPDAFELNLDDRAVSARLHDALYRATESQGAQGRSVTFEFQDTAGLHAKKVFSVGDAKHAFLLTFSVAVENSGRALNPSVSFGTALGVGINLTGSSQYVPPRAIFEKAGKVSRVVESKLGTERTEDGPFTFAGVDDHYFLTAVVLPKKLQKVTYRPLVIPGATEKESRHFVRYSGEFASAPENEQLFLGPKDFDVLAAIDRNMTRAIDFGMFAWLVVPLLRALKWINGFVGNYGWAIILLTILINLVMFPLRHKSVVSMRKMQEIQPQVKEIQDRYAKLKVTDPARQKMNTELMNLYRERGVNPASGCVPMLLTMPVLFAFYSMLSVAIELRGAPWVGWIHDLSVHDPLYVTPVLMGITMLWQQRLTPMNADPVQQRMFMFTPIIFTFFFLWAPAGLVLYWLMSNIWAIGQQLITNRIIGPPPAREVRPAAERRIKRAGGGKTQQAARDRKP
jgi:YidC/Oxa1 family membrane protein insertase